TGPRIQLLLVAQMRRAYPLGNDVHRLAVAGGVCRRVACGPRRLSQYIKREAVALFRLVLGVGERLADSLAEHEPGAENTHGLAERLADHWLAASPDQALDDASGRAVPLTPIDDPAGEHQPIGRGIYQQRVGMADMTPPITAADGAGDQPIRRCRIWDA